MRKFFQRFKVVHYMAIIMTGRSKSLTPVNKAKGLIYFIYTLIPQKDLDHSIIKSRLERLSEVTNTLFVKDTIERIIIAFSNPTVHHVILTEVLTILGDTIQDPEPVIDQLPHKLTNIIVQPEILLILRSKGLGCHDMYQMCEYIFALYDYMEVCVNHKFIIDTINTIINLIDGINRKLQQFEA